MDRNDPVLSILKLSHGLMWLKRLLSHFAPGHGILKAGILHLMNIMTPMYHFHFMSFQLWKKTTKFPIYESFFLDEIISGHRRVGKKTFVLHPQHPWFPSSTCSLHAESLRCHAVSRVQYVFFSFHQTTKHVYFVQTLIDLSNDFSNDQTTYIYFFSTSDNKRRTASCSLCSASFLGFLKKVLIIYVRGWGVYILVFKEHCHSKETEHSYDPIQSSRPYIKPYYQDIETQLLDHPQKHSPYYPISLLPHPCSYFSFRSS